MDIGARKWLAKTALKNLWRLPEMDLDDLIQEGHVCYWLLKKRYPLATDAPHVMALFKSTFLNRISDLSRHDRHRKENFTAESTGSSETIQLLINSQVCPFAELAVRISELPPIASKAVALIISTDMLTAPMRHSKSGHRETLNERLCRRLGLDHQQDILLMIKQALT